MTTEASATRARTATLADVAREAGVSVATASKALNGRARVAVDTRDRVIAVADRLSFSPNQMARSLLAGRTGTVGLITGDLEGRFSIPIMMGAEDAFGSGKTAVFLCDARGDSIREQYHLQALLSRRVDGLIIVGSRTDPRPSLGSLSVPVVYVYAPSDDPADTSLVTDDVAAGRLAVEHLVSSGRSRIALVDGEEDYQAARDRALGVEQGLAANGLKLVGKPRFGPWDEAWGRGATRELFDQDPSIDAVIGGSDLVARGAIEALHSLGKDVPGEVAVLGFDNWGVVTNNSRPRLTSVDMGLEELGRLAAHALLDGNPDELPGGVRSVPPRLVTRDSTVGMD
ncbi:MAG: transcriptional regulator, LacI family [Microbacteriaceae bacterium]|nr:transcriptional regulator, LacI family [Microbacteriaceae bacterium]